MRTAMVLALLGFLAVVCTPPPAVAQLKSAPNPARLSLLPSLPASAQTPQASTTTLPTRSNLGHGLPGNQASALRSLASRMAQSNPFGNGSWKSAQPKGKLEANAAAPADTRECAHILIVPRRSADSGMAVKVPNSNRLNSGMPSADGLPPCREDYR